MTFDDTELLDDRLRVALDAYRDSYLGPAPQPAPELMSYLGEMWCGAAPARTGAHLRLVVATATAATVGVLGMLGALPAAAQTVFDKVVTVLTPLDRSPSTAPGPDLRPPSPAEAPGDGSPAHERRSSAHDAAREGGSEATTAGHRVRPTAPQDEPPIGAEAADDAPTGAGVRPGSATGDGPGPARPPQPGPVESDDEAPDVPETDDDESEPAGDTEDEPDGDEPEEADDTEEPDEPDDTRTSDEETDAVELDRRDDDDSRASADEEAD
jgi:hypothetical protein